MNVSGGVIKLERLISSKRALEKKLESHNDDSGMIKKTIKKLEDDIAYIKKEINFDERFEVGKICTCPVESDEVIIEDEEPVVIKSTKRKRKKK